MKNSSLLHCVGSTSTDATEDWDCVLPPSSARLSAAIAIDPVHVKTLRSFLLCCSPNSEKLGFQI